MEWTGVERRTSGTERMKVARPVSIFAGDRTHILRAQTVDLSTGGMRIDLADGLPVGERILFRIDLGEGFDPAVQGGEIAWSDGGVGAGVRFSPAEAGPAGPEAASRPGPALPAPGEPVRLHIDRMDRTLKVQCVDAGDWGITVRTELPFLERGKRIVARYRSADGRDGELAGILEDVSLEPDLGERVPGIRLDILTGACPKPAAPCDEPAAEPEPGERAGEAEPVEPAEAIDAAEPPPPAKEDDAWEPEESTQRDAVPPPAAQAGIIEAVETAPEDAVDPMSEAFGSLTQKAGAEGDPPIEPRYVIVLRAVAAWLLVAGRRLGAASAAYASAGWAALLPWIRRTAPRLASRARLTGRLAASIAKGIARRAPAASTAAAMRMRRQKRRTTQVSAPESSPRTLSPLVRRGLLAAMTLAAVAGFATGVWGLVSLIRSGRDDAKASSAESRVQASRGSFDMWGGSALPRGTVVEAEISEIDVAQAEAAPRPQAAPIVPEAAPPAQPEAPPPAAAPAGPIPGTTTDKGFTLGVDGEITGYDYYALKSPPGLVVDVKGALPITEGIQEISLAGVTRVKAVARESGARFIIYFEGAKMPEFQVLPAGPTLEIRLGS